MASIHRINPVTRIPPPLMFVATFVASAGLQRLDPLTIHSLSIIKVSHLIGTGLVGMGLLLAAICIGMFVYVHTTIIPFGTATRLLTSGPYRVTRNPMYLSLVITYLGVAALLTQVWSLLLLPIPVAVIHRIVIPGEEERLRATFGEAFMDYCARVRRWL